MTKDEVKEWFTAGWRGLPMPEESGHAEYAWEIGEEYRRDSDAVAPYAKATIEEAFEEVYAFHFEDLVKYGT